MTQTEQQFESVIKTTLEQIQNLLITKGKEYRRNNNPFHNFERGSEIAKQSKQDVLQGFLLKHLISVEDMRNDAKTGQHSSEEKINEKYNDIIVYFMIEKAMMIADSKQYAESLAKCR